MKDLKKLLARLEEQKKTLTSRKNFVLYYDTAALEFISEWKDNKSFYKQKEIDSIDGLLGRLHQLTGEANGLIAEIENYKQPARSGGAAAARQAVDLTEVIARTADVIARIKKLSAECDVLMTRLPDDLLIGMP